MSDSKWISEFEQHNFQKRWLRLKEQLNAAEIDDKTVATSVAELTRLKRVVAYLDQLLRNLDPELVPRSVWPP